MTHIQTPIIPIEQHYALRAASPHNINKEAICVYAALGFFLGEDGYYKDEQVLQPGTRYVLNDKKNILEQASYFKWAYAPRSISFKAALDEYVDLFETIVKEQSLKKPVILPLSGGLDSRTQATALHYLQADVQAYSYSFENGFKEHRIGEEIANTCGFNFKDFRIPNGYLWDHLNNLANINQCYSDFTHPRQMAVLPELKQMPGEFSLGHWGDVLFDKGILKQDESLPELDIVYKKIVKPSGLVLARMLWDNWNLAGTFETYLRSRLQTLLDGIDIDHKGAKIRAFKSLYWAPRWTSVNLSIFKAAHPIHLPYYDDRICRFICELPEEHLADRKLQIAYIKQRNPKLAGIMWQSQKPYNLFNYHKNKPPLNLPYRVKNKLWRHLNEAVGKPYIQRNWELQFLGSDNDKQLKDQVFDENFIDFVGGHTVSSIYNKFTNENPVSYAHALSMLLTLSVWRRREMHEL